ncbi:MAG: Fe-S cluster assembly protein SufD [Calditrichaeota bacterium]|nr:MAG: Fe-S cluster assembly protein SufD [Calditrichota bacterium]MBL1204118.1 Fe-S cluster assembly protein SufD [Calditrichota bacterium]NOG43949.1 Fe-S cluster assembly protein SufD [Calditrichota bacterium]
MNTKDQNSEKYLKAFNSYFNGQAKQSFHKIREDAIDNFDKLGFPSTKKEEWRFTNIAGIAKSDFKIAKRNLVDQVTEKDVESFLYKNWQGTQIVFIDGFFSEKLSKIENISDKISIKPLSAHLESDNDFVSEKISQLASYENEAFVALNTAFTTEGCAITIPDNIVEKNGVHIVNIAASAGCLSNPRNMLICGKNSEALVVESYHTLSDEEVFVNSVTEIFMDENANLYHYKLQNESFKSNHIGNTAINQKANSNYISASFDFGGKLVRNNISTELDGEGINSTLNGLYIAKDAQHIDNHTFIDHAKAHCESHELYRGILKDQAKGVFSGKILVRQDAQKTDAKQSNNCLLLSEDAQIDAKPQLEIYADDVKCTHGATVGQLDESALFYFRARGIPKEKALSMLTYAFAEEVITGVKSKPLQDQVEQLLLQRLSS